MKTILITYRFDFTPSEKEKDYIPIKLKVCADVATFLFKTRYHISSVYFSLYSDDDISIPLDILSDDDFHNIRLMTVNLFDSEFTKPAQLKNEELYT